MVEFTEFGADEVDSRALEYHGRGERVYAEGRQVLTRACHDAYVSYPNENGEKGIILVRRKSEPAKGYLWGFGGGINRGVPLFESLANKVKEESNLDIDNPILIGVDRYLWDYTQNSVSVDGSLPKGADDLALIFYCEGLGELKLNDLHETPVIVTPEMYTPEFSRTLYPSVRKNLEAALSYLTK